MSSVYTWRVTGPAGPLAPLYGHQVRCLPPQAGAYRIELWQHNAALPAGVRRVPLPPATAAEECVGRSIVRQGKQAARQAQPLIP